MFRQLAIIVVGLAHGVTGAAAILPQGAVGAKTIDVRFPVPPVAQEYAAKGGNPVPSTGRLVIMVPPGFDSRGSWPVLIVNSTSDGGRTGPMDAPYYQAAAAPEGWVIVATDATIRPRTDSTVWRLALLSAGLDVIHRDWSGSARWPVVFAGMSGGAKRSEWISAMMAQIHSLNICGIFLAGINEDRMPEVLKSYPARPEFFRLPIWISSGSHDPIATPGKSRDVQGSLTHLGFKNVRLSQFQGGHELDRFDLRNALKWFRQECNFPRP